MIALVAAAVVFGFETDTPGQPPKGFELALTGKGKPGRWIVQAVADAPSGKNVLAQLDGDDTFKDAGKFGVWTKADSIIQFDDLTATPKEEEK